VVSSRNDDENQAALQQFALGDLDVMAQLGMLYEGYDNPLISVVRMMKPIQCVAWM
jgi:superfamily II DNA or RNA helicase